MIFAMTLQLNQSAGRVCQSLIDDPARYGVEISQLACGARVIDCGVNAPGGLEAGRTLAEICLAGLGRVEFVPSSAGSVTTANVVVTTDHPVAACMASQYAGWEIKSDDFFAMGSGPMRAVGSREKLFDDIGFREEANENVYGVLESGKLPPDAIAVSIAESCRIEPAKLTLLVAPTASIAGVVQIVARSIETALHKMHELKFDLSQVKTGMGVAPLPPVASDDMAGIGRTNDAILYGAEAMLWMTGDDAELMDICFKTPSCTSADHGKPFGELFAGYDYDFYKIDPLLFAPAMVSFTNLETGASYRYGEFRPDIMRESFGLKDS